MPSDAELIHADRSVILTVRSNQDTFEIVFGAEMDDITVCQMLAGIVLQFAAGSGCPVDHLVTGLEHYLHEKPLEAIAGGLVS